jgi:hypothetical protein
VSVWVRARSLLLAVIPAISVQAMRACVAGWRVGDAGRAKNGGRRRAALM